MIRTRGNDMGIAIEGLAGDAAVFAALPGEGGSTDRLGRAGGADGARMHPGRLLRQRVGSTTGWEEEQHTVISLCME